eukprot:Skav229887  [mRNA]  locus=scaffold247:461961:466875:+ [translate_table: standard]
MLSRASSSFKALNWPFRKTQLRGLNKACGLVGYPNVGKSSLFNAFVGSTVAAAENFPFCTIEPNVVKVGVPDARLDRLAELCASQRTARGSEERFQVSWRSETSQG